MDYEDWEVYTKTLSKEELRETVLMMAWRVMLLMKAQNNFNNTIPLPRDVREAWVKLVAPAYREVEKALDDI